MVNPKYLTSIITGWVSEDRVFPWQTREALEFDRDSTLATAPERRQTPLRVFATKEDAINWSKGEAVDSLFEEKFNQEGESPQISFDRMRYPLAGKGIDTVEGGNALQGRLHRPASRQR